MRLCKRGYLLAVDVLDGAREKRDVVGAIKALRLGEDALHFFGPPPPLLFFGAKFHKSTIRSKRGAKFGGDFGALFKLFLFM